MIILGIDTAANLCAACLFDTVHDAELGRSVRDLGRGHGEHLMAVIDEALDASGKTFADLGMIAVCVGPGSFTGIRVGVSTARGLALALAIPAVGVTTLEALAAETRQKHPGRAVLAAIDGGRGQVHAALFDPSGNLQVEPAALTMPQAVDIAIGASAVLCGSAAAVLAQHGSSLVVASAAPTADILTYARSAAGKPSGGPRPSPLYLRGADAKVQEGFAVPRKDRA